MLDLDHIDEGTKLRVARTVARLSLFDVAMRAGVAPQRLSEYERGRAGSLTPDAINRVRAVLNTANAPISQAAPDATT